MENKKIKTERGSITIEMALLFPLVIFVIMFFIMSTYYLQDIISIRAYLSGNELEEITESEKNELYQEVKNLTTVVDVRDINLTETNHGYQIVVRTKLHIPFWKFLSTDSIEVNIEKKSNYQDIIKEKVIIDTVNDVTKGGEN